MAASPVSTAGKTLKYLPPVTFSVAPQAVLNQVAARSTAQDQQATVCAENAPLRLTFGTDRVGAQVAYALAYQGRLVLLCVWGFGEIDGVSQIQIADAAMPGSVIAHHYTGTATQTVDALLAAAFAAQTPAKTWTSALPGIAYSVLSIPPGLSSGFPTVTALIRGAKLFDPRNGPAAGTTSLEFVSTVTGGGNCYAYRRILAPSYTVQAGDVLTYDVWIDPRNPGISSGAGGIEVDFTTAPFNGRSVPLPDQFGDNCNNLQAAHYSAGVWATRTISLAPIVGKVLSSIDLVNEQDIPGWYRALYRNIRITDGASATRLAIWSSGAPAVNVDAYSALVSGVAVAEVQATRWSDNPALALAHFIGHLDGYGMGKAVNVASAIATANACDELVGGEKRRLIGLTLDTPQSDKAWIEALRTYAGCFVHGLAADEVKLIPDRPRAAVRTLDFAAGQIIDIGPIELTDITNAPTFVQIGWRDTTSTPWRDTYGPGAYAPGVAAGSVDYIPSQVALYGIRRRSQAAREEIERLNKLNLSNMSFPASVFDEQLDVEIGDRIDIVHPLIGPAAKPMVVVRVEGEYGRYKLGLAEYDPAVYSDVVVAEPTWSDTSLPTPATPPAPTGLVLVEEGFTAADGTNHTRIKATWAGVTYPFLTSYRVTLRSGAAIIDTLTAATPEARSGTLQEGVSYQVDVQTVSTTGAASAALSATLLVTGAGTLPGNPSGWGTAIEAGGTVFLAWLPVAGSTRYRLKYGAVGGSYAAATRIDDLDGTTYQATGIPAGTWRFWLAALNRTGALESVAPIYRDIVVTLDPALLITERTFTAPTLAAMSYYKADRTLPGAWVTDFGDGFGFGHADTNNATGTFADLASTPFAHPHTAGTSAWESESWDLVSSIAGAWSVDASVIALSGAATVKLRLSPDNATWTDYTWAGTPISATGRYARVRIETAGTMQIAEPVKASLIVAARRDPNAGVITTSASGATTVTLANKYIQAKTISLTPKGTTAKTVTFDNLVLGAGSNTFDVYAFNAAGAQIAADVSWSFEGI